MILVTLKCVRKNSQSLKNSVHQIAQKTNSIAWAQGRAGKRAVVCWLPAQRQEQDCQLLLSLRVLVTESHDLEEVALASL